MSVESLLERKRIEDATYLTVIHDIKGAWTNMGLMKPYDNV